VSTTLNHGLELIVDAAKHRVVGPPRRSIEAPLSRNQPDKAGSCMFEGMKFLKNETLKGNIEGKH
jgi:hypothetical protein